MGGYCRLIDEFVYKEFRECFDAVVFILRTFVKCSNCSGNALTNILFSDI